MEMTKTFEGRMEIIPGIKNLECALIQYENSKGESINMLQDK